MTRSTALLDRRLGGAPVTSGGALPRLLPPGAGDGSETLDQHIARCGPTPHVEDESSRESLLVEIDRACLIGRGGARFPTARKLRAVAAMLRTPVVVANGTEGEPASAKDRVLLARAPNLVLDGAALAAELVGAPEVILVVHPAVREVVDAAARERRHTGHDRVRLRIVTAAERFVAGEASAVVSWIERGVPAPRVTPPRLAERGLAGRPTLVQNVETLAHLALIARRGADWYRAVGTDEEPGSTLVTVLGAVNAPGVYEVAIGTPVRNVLALAGGPAAALQALLFGGYFGAWAGADDVLDVPFSAAGLGPSGASVGAGLVAAMPDDECGLVETARVVRYLASQSAGQCGPCVFGLPALAGELELLAAGAGFESARLSRWLEQVDGRGACSHPDGAVRLIRSALRAFRGEVARHADGYCCATGGGVRILPVPEELAR
jgi:NADH:ubiquinone oxidoreductase subunit F (NADH-binding)